MKFSYFSGFDKAIEDMVSSILDNPYFSSTTTKFTQKCNCTCRGIHKRKNEDTGDLEIFFDVPGFEKDDVSISVQNKMLLVNTKTEKKVGDEERKFNYRFSIPEEYNEEGIQATLKHGILTVTLPLKQEAQKKEIKING